MATVVMTKKASERRLDLPGSNRRLLGSLTLRSSPCPIHRLPDELLYYTLLFANHDSHDISDTVTTPLTISHVCSRWRGIALSMGRLWTTITMTFPHTSAQLHRIKTWLKRSRSCPLDIFLDFRDAEWNWEEDGHAFSSEHMQQVLSHLLPHITRWRSFELLCDTWHPIFTFLCLTRDVDSAPFLRHVALSRCNAYFASKGQVFAPASLKQAIPLFGGLPSGSLSSISLAGVHGDWSSTALRGLTELELKYHASDVMPSLHDFLDILSASPGLQVLSVIGWGPRLDRSPLTHVNENNAHASIGQCGVQLLNLRRFAFGYLDINYAIRLLRFLSMPGLEDFSVEDVSRSLNPMEALDATPLFEWFVAGPASTAASAHKASWPLSRISRLELNGTTASNSSFARFLLALESLGNLSLSNIDNDMISALDPHELAAATNDSIGKVAPLCPLLTEITCDAENISSLAKMVLSRKDKSCPLLQTIHVSVPDDTDLAIDDCDFARFLSSGVKLLVSS